MFQRYAAEVTHTITPAELIRPARRFAGLIPPRHEANVDARAIDGDRPTPGSRQGEPTTMPKSVFELLLARMMIIAS